MKVLVDTSVVIGPEGAEWPEDAELAISTITVAELGFGVVKAGAFSGAHGYKGVTLQNLELDAVESRRHITRPTLTLRR